MALQLHANGNLPFSVEKREVTVNVQIKTHKCLQVLKGKQRKQNSVGINYFTLLWNICSQANIKKKAPSEKNKLVSPGQT